MKVFVIGASGFVGSYLCNQLLKDGHRVVGLSRSLKNRTRLESIIDNDKFSFYKGDIRNKEMMMAIMAKEKFNAVFHLSSLVPYLEEKDFIGVNITGTQNLLEAAKRSGVKDFVYSSSISVYSTPPDIKVDESHPTYPDNIYGITKITAEMICQLYTSMNIKIVRYAGVYGNYSEPNRTIPVFTKLALSNNPITIRGNGQNSSDFVSVYDVVKGTILSWHKGIGVYNIGSGEETKVIDLAKTIVEVTNSKSEIKLDNTNIERPFRFRLDISKARKELGYNPIDLKNGLRQYVEEIRYN
jgi:UDP-glucose 4-epimerase